MQSRGITALPVTIIDDDEVIIGYYPKKLIPALRLEVEVDLSGKTGWLAAKYDMLLGATRRIQQLSDAQLQQRLPWRERWTLRDLMMHVLSFPELAWLSHQHGSMSTDDMRASDARLRMSRHPRRWRHTAKASVSTLSPSCRATTPLPLIG